MAGTFCRDRTGFSYMFMIEGYFDESGDLDRAPGIFCVSGYFIETEAAKLMDAEWLAILEKYQLAFFHMVDCAHGNEGFKHLTKAERATVVIELIGLIKKYTLEGFSVFAKADSYETQTGAPDVYSDCALGCVQAVQAFLTMNRVEGDIAYFFERGHKNRHTAYNHIGRKIRRPTDTLTFATKEQVRLLQAADLLAWQSAKYAKDYFYPRMYGEKPKRAPRKDFQSLMEHSHIFTYMGERGRKNVAGIELWPMRKRSRHSVNLSVKDDVSLTHWVESGESTPIIPVERTVGWRPGGAQFSYVAFKNLNGQQFALSFDEPRLFEAITHLLEAAAMYEEGKTQALFSADNLSVDDLNDHTILHIKIRGGATVAFHLRPELVTLLKEILAIQ
jgi:uncharacterized protein DUF3800